MIVSFIDYLKERPRTIRTIAYIVMAVILVWSYTGVDTHHAHTWMEAHIPGFWAIFGIISALLLVFFALWFGKSGIMTREDYYDN